MSSPRAPARNQAERRPLDASSVACPTSIFQEFSCILCDKSTCLYRQSFILFGAGISIVKIVTIGRLAIIEENHRGLADVCIGCGPYKTLGGTPDIRRYVFFTVVGVGFKILQMSVFFLQHMVTVLCWSFHLPYRVVFIFCFAFCCWYGTFEMYDFYMFFCSFLAEEKHEIPLTGGGGTWRYMGCARRCGAK